MPPSEGKIQAKIDAMIGKRYGRLTIIALDHLDTQRRLHWECLCDCGNTSYPSTGQLNYGGAYSCGCYQQEVAAERFTIHGLSKQEGYEKHQRDLPENKEKKKQYDSKYRILKYGITLEEHAKMLIAQENKCMICQNIFSIDSDIIDHNHDTSKVRALLCRYCNLMLGLFCDNIAIINSAIKYLTRELIIPVLDDQEYRGNTKNSRRKRKYGINTPQFNYLLEQQKDKCGICDKLLTKPFIDHCHLTGKVRGILCNSCNTGIGMAKDSFDTLLSLTTYLIRFD